MLYWRTDLHGSRAADLRRVAPARRAARARARRCLRVRLAGRALRGAGDGVPRAARRVRRAHPRRARTRGRGFGRAVDALDVRCAIDRRRTASCRASVLTWQEEQTRFAFQNGQAVFMRNWPYAYALLQDRRSRASPDGSPSRRCRRTRGGSPTAALGGRSSRSTRNSGDPEAAYRLIDVLTSNRRRCSSARASPASSRRGRSLYDSRTLAARAVDRRPSDARRIIEHAVAAPRDAGLHRAVRDSADRICTAR